MLEARLHVRVQPSARANEVLGFQGDTLRLRVTAPPERGRANEEVVELVGRTLGVARGQVTVLRGAASRDKLLLIDGLDAAGVMRRLGVQSSLRG